MLQPAAPTTPLEAARAAFAPVHGFLDTATAGLPPRATVAALTDAVLAWQAGRLDAGAYDAAVARSRAAFARLVGVGPGDVAIGAQVSALTGLVAAALPAGTEVLVAEEEFTSVLFPFLAVEARGVRVRAVPLDRLVEAIDARTGLVAVSATQSADGRTLDLDALAAAAGHHGAPVFLDATQAAGWLPIDASRFAYVAVGAYKWLLSPRGAAFLAVAPERRDGLVPNAAGWYAGEDPWTALYGGPLRLAADARRFDVSPAWLAWAGAAPALELVASLDPAELHAHDIALADRFRAGLGLPPGDSAIVAFERPDAVARLAAAGVRVTGRGGRARAAFHVYTTSDDVDRALEALG